MYAARENLKSKKNHVHEYELLHLVFMEQLSQLIVTDSTTTGTTTYRSKVF